MPVPSSGPISLSDIQAAFGGASPISLSEYYAGGANVPAGTTGVSGPVPSSGTISVSNFYGASSAEYRLDSGVYSDTAVFGISDAGVSLSINSDGTVQINASTSGLLDSYDWITPTTGSTAHFVRATVTSGSFTSGATDTWEALTSNREWSVDQSVPGSKQVSALFQIATDSGGANVVVSANITLEATVDP
jgi:hypothetical protein